MAYRCLGYPFPISKTGLVAVGSPHTWPALIAAIDWLVDVLTIRDEEEVHDWGPDDISSTAADSRGVLTMDASLELIDSQFHHFLRKSIGAFLKENDEECADLEGLLLDTFQKDHLRVEENLTALDNECEEMKEEIASLSAEVDGYVIYVVYSD
jgi:kinetochore protein NDC80